MSSFVFLQTNMLILENKIIIIILMKFVIKGTIRPKQSKHGDSSSRVKLKVVECTTETIDSTAYTAANNTQHC